MHALESPAIATPVLSAHASMFPPTLTGAEYRDTKLPFVLARNDPIKDERAEMIVRRYFLSIAAVLAVWQFAQSPLIAQSPLGPLLAPASDQTAPPPAAAPTVAEKRAENAELLRVAERKVESDPANAAAAAELSAYKTAETILAQQEAVEQQIHDLDVREKELRKELKDWSTTASDPVATVSFVEFDRLVNRLAAEQARTELVRSKLKAAKAAQESAQTELNTREQERRKAQEALEAGKTGPDAAALVSALDEAKRASTLAADNASLRKKELERDKLADTVQGLTIELLKGKVDRYQTRVVFTAAELQDQLQRLKTEEESVRKSLKSADENASTNARNWILAKRRLKAAGGDDPVLNEEVEAWHRERDSALEQKNAALDQLLQIEQLRTAWNRLYKLMSGSVELAPEELTSWKDETASVLKMLIGSTQAHLLRIDELRGELATVLSKADAAKEGPEKIRDAVARQRAAIESMIRTHEANLVSIDASRRLHGKLRTELGRGIDLLSPRQWAHEMWNGAVWLWDYELAATIDDRSVTVGKIFARW